MVVEPHGQAHHTAQPLDVVIRPTRDPLITQRRVKLSTREGILPTRRVVVDHVLVDPRVAAAVAVGEHLVAERLEHEELIGVIGELAHLMRERNSSGTHQELIRNSSGTHQELIRDS